MLRSGRLTCAFCGATTRERRGRPNGTKIVAGQALGKGVRWPGRSSKVESEMLDHFKAPMAKAAIQYRAELMFDGQAIFTDFFDRQFLCIWECDGRSGEFKLTRHEQRLHPDKKQLNAIVVSPIAGCNDASLRLCRFVPAGFLRLLSDSFNLVAIRGCERSSPRITRSYP